MGAALQNYQVSQGETLSSLITLQVPGQPFTTLGTTAIGSTTITGINTAGIVVGDSITGPGIQDVSIVTSIGSGTITITNPAIAAGNVTLTFSEFDAVNLSGQNFLFSAKTAVPPINTTQDQAYSLPDVHNPVGGVVEFNWVEYNTPTLGQTWLIIPDTITLLMAAGTWWYLIRAVGSLGVSSDLLTGMINVTKPPSVRIN